MSGSDYQIGGPTVEKTNNFFFVVFYSSVLCLIYVTVRSNNIGMKIAHAHTKKKAFFFMSVSKLK